MEMGLRLPFVYKILCKHLHSSVLFIYPHTSDNNKNSVKSLINNTFFQVQYNLFKKNYFFILLKRLKHIKTKILH